MPESTTEDAPDADLAPLVPPAGIEPDAVRLALAHVLESEELRSSPQLSNILRFVVEATLDGRRDAIKGYTIAVEALGRDPSFDPQADPIVRVEATRLRRALERYYAGAGAGDDIEIMVPRGSYVPHFVPRRDAGPGSVIPEIFDGDRPAEIDGAPAVQIAPPADRWSAGRLVGAMLMVAAVLFLGVMAYDSIDPNGWRALVSSAALHPVDRTNRLGIPMIEVRPFDATGGNAAPIGEGVANANANASTGEFPARAIEVRVRDALARFDLVDVLASPDARPVLNCGVTGVSPHSAFALGGLVENHDDGTISVLLRLSDLCDGTIVWSREFDSLRRNNDPTATEVALVRDIMAAIAEPYGVIQARARARVTAAGGPATAGPYGCVLQAYSYWRSYLPAEHAQARECLERVVQADGTFSLGYALLAELYLDEMRNGVNPRPGPPALNRALATIEHAVELAPTSAYVRRVLMDVHFFRGERGQAIAAGDAALALNPYDVDVLADFGGRLIALGDVGRGEVMLTSAQRAAPGMPPWVDYHRVIAAYLRGDAPAATAAADHLMGDGYAPGLMARALASHIAGEDQAARTDLRKLVEVAPDWSREPGVMIARFFPDPATAEHVKTDLRAAGLQIPIQSAAKPSAAAD